MKAKFYPGELKTRINMIQVIATSSPTGDPVKVAQTFASCYANQFDVKGSEDEDGKIRFLFDVGFVVRYNKSFIKGQINGMQIEDTDGFKYNIVSVISKIPKRYLQINAVRSE